MNSKYETYFYEKMLCRNATSNLGCAANLLTHSLPSVLGSIYLSP
jgi:hypothetical protein